jgi:alcohol dehydrogenase class IV
MEFEFATSTQIIFGRGSIQKISNILPELGSSCLVITGKHFSERNPVLNILDRSNVNYRLFTVSGEPTDTVIHLGVAQAIEQKTDFILAMGGGSVLDAGKAIGMLLTNNGEVLDYIEVVGRGKKISKPSTPVIAIPTTAGTGSEVTKNAVITLVNEKIKASLRSPLMVPRVAIVDPELLISLPPESTAFTGMDALTQVIEPYLSKKANLLIDSLCLPAIRMGYKSLLDCYHHPEDIEAREKMAYVSLVGGIALANAGLGAVHGFAAAIGGMFPIAHGAICACLLPAVIEGNYKAISGRDPGNSALIKYHILAETLPENKGGTVAGLFDCLYKLHDDLHIPKITELGFDTLRISDVVEKASVASSMKANPIQLMDNEIEEMLATSL